MTTYQGSFVSTDKNGVRWHIHYTYQLDPDTGEMINEKIISKTKLND